jgi:hypothetical protein
VFNRRKLLIGTTEHDLNSNYSDLILRLAGERTLSLRVRGSYTLYVDGVQQTGLPSGDSTATVSLKSSASYIAIQAQATAGSSLRGILASVTGNIIVTGSQWVCTSSFTANWWTAGSSVSIICVPYQLWCRTHQLIKESILVM